MSNYPAGAQYDPRAPYNEVPVHRRFSLFYYQADIQPFCGCGMPIWYSCYIEDGMITQDAEACVESWCSKKGYALLDISHTHPHTQVIPTEDYYHDN